MACESRGLTARPVRFKKDTNMKSSLGKIWKDPVFSKIIATGLIFLIGAIGTWFFGIWPYLKNGLAYIYSGFIYEIYVPVWSLFLAIPFLLFLFPMIQKFKKKEEPSFIKYTHDHILGIDWSWDWLPPGIYNKKYSIKNVRPRCPDCKSILEINDYSGQLVHCINDECKWRWQQQGHFDNRISHSSKLNQKVVNIIDRKTHNKEY